MQNFKLLLRKNTFNTLLFGTLGQHTVFLVRIFGGVSMALLTVLFLCHLFHLSCFPPHSLKLAGDTPNGMLLFLAGKFFDEFFWVILTLPLISAFLVGAFWILYVYAFFVVNEAHKQLIVTTKQNLKTSSEREGELSAENEKMREITLAFSQKQKKQRELFPELIRRRQTLIDKTSYISYLLSHSLIEPDATLTPEEIEKLLAEVSTSSQNLVEHLFDIQHKQPLSLSQCLKEIQHYIQWNLLRAEVTFSLETIEEGTFEVDAFAFKILLINLLLHHIGRAYEGATLSCCVMVFKTQVEIRFQCTDAIKASTASEYPLSSDPLALPKESLPKLAQSLGLECQTSKGVITRLFMKFPSCEMSSFYTH